MRSCNHGKQIPGSSPEQGYEKKPCVGIKRKTHSRGGSWRSCSKGDVWAIGRKEPKEKRAENHFWVESIDSFLYCGLFYGDVTLSINCQRDGLVCQMSVLSAFPVCLLSALEAEYIPLQCWCPFIMFSIVIMKVLLLWRGPRAGVPGLDSLTRFAKMRTWSFSLDILSQTCLLPAASRIFHSFPNLMFGNKKLPKKPAFPGSNSCASFWRGETLPVVVWKEEKRVVLQTPTDSEISPLILHPAVFVVTFYSV